MISIPVQSGEKKSKTRLAWAREGGGRMRYSVARVGVALRARIRAGWIPVIPPGRSLMN
jgi:hypothetical protein